MHILFKRGPGGFADLEALVVRPYPIKYASGSTSISFTTRIFYPEVQSMWPKSNHPPISNDFKRIPAHAFLGVNMFKFLKILICLIFGSIVCPTNIFELLLFVYSFSNPRLVLCLVFTE